MFAIIPFALSNPTNQKLAQTHSTITSTSVNFERNVRVSCGACAMGTSLVGRTFISFCSPLICSKLLTDIPHVCETIIPLTCTHRCNTTKGFADTQIRNTLSERTTLLSTQSSGIGHCERFWLVECGKRIRRLTTFRFLCNANGFSGSLLMYPLISAGAFLRASLETHFVVAKSPQNPSHADAHQWCA